MTDNQINICKNTLDNLKVLCKNKNHAYTPLDVYYKPSGQQMKKVALLQCNEHNSEPFEQDIQDVFIFRRSKKCPKCFSTIQTNNIRVSIRDLNKRIQKSKNTVIRNNQIVIRYSNCLYKNANTIVEVRCNLFGHHHSTYLQRTSSIGKTNICPECVKTREARKQGENLIEKINTILFDHKQNFKFDGEIERNYKGIIFYALKCRECECLEWEREKYIKSVKCKVCFPNDSKGESKIIEYLKNLEIPFEKQKKFNGLKNEKELRCDFYIPKFNLIIEFDGHQHYYPIAFFKGFESFKKTIKCDWIKNRYTLKNRINILRIPYFNYDKIESLIYQAINRIIEGQEINKISYLPLIIKRRNKILTIKK